MGSHITYMYTSSDIYFLNILKPGHRFIKKVGMISIKTTSELQTERMNFGIALQGRPRLGAMQSRQAGGEAHSGADAGAGGGADEVGVVRHRHQGGLKNKPPWRFRVGFSTKSPGKARLSGLILRRHNFIFFLS